MKIIYAYATYAILGLICSLVNIRRTRPKGVRPTQHVRPVPTDAEESVDAMIR